MESNKHQIVEAHTERPAANRLVLISSAYDEAFKTFADAEIEFALSQLESADIDKDTAVHQCRKSIKRLRALARIGRAVPGARPRKIDRRLRRAGRALAPVRDAAEVKKTMQNLASSDPKLSKLKGFERFSVKAANANADSAKKKAINQLQKARADLPELFTGNDGWTIANVAAGIEVTYAQAVRDMNKFARNRSAKRAHAWRKEVQRLKNQLRLFEAVFPQHQSLPGRELRELASVLGEKNDLAVLRAKLKAMRRKLPKKTRSALRDAAKQRQRGLGKQALAIGREVFGDEPAEFRYSLEKNSNVIALK